MPHGIDPATESYDASPPDFPAEGVGDHLGWSPAEVESVGEDQPHQLCDSQGALDLQQMVGEEVAQVGPADGSAHLVSLVEGCDIPDCRYEVGPRASPSMLS